MTWEPSERFGEWQGCRGCAHYRQARCVAYPERIPLVILSGEVDHMVPRPGQVGDTVFEPMDWEVFRATGQRVPAGSAAPTAPRARA
jgi:hypothetical protein